jgi:hypothetical protein
MIPTGGTNTYWVGKLARIFDRPVDPNLSITNTLDTFQKLCGRRSIGTIPLLANRLKRLSNSSGSLVSQIEIFPKTTNERLLGDMNLETLARQSVCSLIAVGVWSVHVGALLT